MKIQYTHGFGFTGARDICTDWEELEVGEEEDLGDYLKAQGIRNANINGIYYVINESYLQTGEYYRQKGESILFYEYLINGIADELRELGVASQDADDLIEVYGYSEYEAERLSDRLALLEQISEDESAICHYRGR